MDKAVIDTEGLSKKYGRKVAVHNATWSLDSGQVLALVGENGAGKSTLLKMLLGLVPISDGRATVLGMEPQRHSVAIRRRVGYVPERHEMYPWMTIGELLRFTSAFYPTWNDHACDRYLNAFNLDPGQKIKNLSRGMLAKAGLLLALSHEPELLILDEPTSGLDAKVRKQFLESIVDVCAEGGRTVVISSHLLNEIEAIANRVLYMDAGNVLLHDDIDAIKDRIREVRITFPSPPTGVTVELAGLISEERSEQEWLLVVDDFSDEKAAALTAQLPDARIHSTPMNLESIFLALAS